MTREQINKEEMYETFNSFLDEQASVWSAIPIVSTYKTRLMEIIEQIGLSAADQEAAKVYLSKSIKQLKHQISIKMDILDDLLEAYAEDQEDATLLSLAQNSKSSYYKLSHEEFELKTQKVIDLIEEKLEALADYGMTAEELTEVKTSFNLFQTKRGKPRAYKIASRMATTNLEELFKEGDAIISRLSKVMKRFKRSNPSFYSGFEAASLVVND